MVQPKANRASNAKNTIFSLAIITVQQRIVAGIFLISLFALGHCLPIVVAGSSVALSQKFVEGRNIQKLTSWGKKFAGLLVAAVGDYFILIPFIN